MYQMSAEAGWMREVVTGDRKCSDPERMRIAYLPPHHLRHIKNRLYSKTQLQDFLSTHCQETTLTLENFSFSNFVLGLDLPWEEVRPARLSQKQVPGQSFSFPPPFPVLAPANCLPPANCLHCGQQLSQSEAAADQHVRLCLHSKNARLRSLLEGGDYSPAQHARPVKNRQSMPDKRTTPTEREGSSDRKVTKQDRQSLPNKTDTREDGQSKPDRTITKQHRQSLPDRTFTKQHRQSLLDKTVTKQNRQSLPGRTVTKQNGQSLSVKTVTKQDRQNLPDRTVTKQDRQSMSDSLQSSPSQRLRSLPDCISVSKLSLSSWPNAAYSLQY